MGEVLSFTRLMMVIGSLSPLFILTAIKGSTVIGDVNLIFISTFLIVVPNIVLYIRIYFAKQDDDVKTFTVESVSDNTEHLLVYLFAVMIPLFQADLDKTSEVAMISVVFIFIVFLFMHLNLHYMNFIFAIFKYRIFTLSISEQPKKIAVLTKNNYIETGDRKSFIRISNTVYMER